MPRLEILSEVQRRMLEFFPCMESDHVPWTPLGKPLADSTVAIVTTAGLHLKDDKPFNRDHPGGESTYRILPADYRTPPDIVSEPFQHRIRPNRHLPRHQRHISHRPHAGVGRCRSHRFAGSQQLLIHGGAARLHRNRGANRARSCPDASRMDGRPILFS